MNAISAVERTNRPWALLVRRVLKLLLALPFRLWTGFRVIGGGRLPAARRPMIVACNHAAFIDSVYWIFALAPRFTICGAKPRLFRSAGLRFLMALANILEVRSREQFLADCGALLDAGEVLLIYPEMGRNPDGLGEFQDWAARVAVDHGAPLLPCYLHGTTRGHRGPPRLIVGEEIEPEDDVEALNQRLRAAIEDLAGAPS